MRGPSSEEMGRILMPDASDSPTSRAHGRMRLSPGEGLRLDRVDNDIDYEDGGVAGVVHGRTPEAPRVNIQVQLGCRRCRNVSRNPVADCFCLLSFLSSFRRRSRPLTSI